MELKIRKISLFTSDSQRGITRVGRMGKISNRVGGSFRTK